MARRPRPSLPRRVLRILFSAVLVPVLLFEEWGWSALSAALHRLERLPLWRWLEQRIAALPPWAALLVFAVPVLVLAPLKLVALYLFGTGKATAGVLLLIGAKLAGTALVAWLFQLTQPALMRLPGFAHAYGRWKAFKDPLLARVRNTLPWRAARALRLRTRRWWRNRKRAARA